MRGSSLNLKVTVQLRDLINALQTNKRLHQEDYKKAVSVYFEELLIKAKDIIKHANELDTQFNYNFHLPIPVDNSKQYDKYIGMFSMAQGETIEVSTDEYDAIVNDSWDWALSASVSNAAYSSKFRV